MGPASHMVVSVHEYYQANQMVKAGEDNIMTMASVGPQTISCCGGAGRGLVLPGWSKPQPPTPHPSESLFT